MELERLAASLERQGYYVHLSRGTNDWTRSLYNAVSKPDYVPKGSGMTALEAVEAAVRNRDARKVA